MTLEFYKKEEARLLKTLSEKDPSDHDYNTILGNLENLALHVFRTQDVEERLRYAEENDAIDQSDGYVATQTGTIYHISPPVVKEAPAEEHPVEQPFPEPEPKPAEEASTSEITPEFFRSELKRAAKAGVKVNPILVAAGYSALSEVPEGAEMERVYADVMAALDGRG